MNTWTAVIVPFLFALALQGCIIGGPGKIIESAVTGDWRTDYERLCLPPEKITDDARLFCEWNKPKPKATD